MSVIGMTSARVARQKGAAASGPALRSGGPNAPDKEGVLTQLIRYTPSDVIAFYIAAVSFLPEIPTQSGLAAKIPIWDYDFRPRWIVFVFFVAGTVLAVWALQMERSRKAKVSFEWPVFEMIVAPIAFAAWAMALPLAPLFSWHSWHAWIGALIAGGTLFVIAQIAKATGRALTYEPAPPAPVPPAPALT